MTNYHHKYKPYEMILGRPHTLLLISGQRFRFKAMELEQKENGRYYLKGYDTEQNWIEIPTNEIAYATNGL